MRNIERDSSGIDKFTQPVVDNNSVKVEEQGGWYLGKYIKAACVGLYTFFQAIFNNFIYSSDKKFEATNQEDSTEAVQRTSIRVHEGVREHFNVVLQTDESINEVEDVPKEELPLSSPREEVKQIIEKASTKPPLSDVQTNTREAVVSKNVPTEIREEEDDKKEMNPELKKWLSDTRLDTKENIEVFKKHKIYSLDDLKFISPADKENLCKDLKLKALPAKRFEDNIGKILIEERFRIMTLDQLVDHADFLKKNIENINKLITNPSDLAPPDRLKSRNVLAKIQASKNKTLEEYKIVAKLIKYKKGKEAASSDVKNEAVLKDRTSPSPFKDITPNKERKKIKWE